MAETKQHYEDDTRIYRDDTDESSNISAEELEALNIKIEQRELKAKRGRELAEIALQQYKETGHVEVVCDNCKEAPVVEIDEIFYRVHVMCKCRDICLSRRLS